MAALWACPLGGLHEAVAAVMAREREHPLGFVDEGRLTHAGLNAAVALLGLAPPLTRDAHHRTLPPFAYVSYYSYRVTRNTHRFG